jgi:hypothetical protein
MNRPGTGGTILTLASTLTLMLASVATALAGAASTGATLAGADSKGAAFDGAASERTIVGRLIDVNGASVAGATVLIFPSPALVRPDGGSRRAADPAGATGTRTPAEEASATRLSGSGARATRSDADGVFVALLPPGRYMVAAVKRGYDVSLTEIHSEASRVLRMRLHGNGSTAPLSDRALDWALRGERADILRDTGASVDPVVYMAGDGDPGAAEAGGAAAADPGPARDPARALLGPVDGEFAQSLGAGEILGLEQGTPLNAERATALSVGAPISPGLGWQVDGRSVRTRSDLGAGEDGLAGRSDRLAVTIDRSALDGARVSGRLRAGFGSDGAGTALIRTATLQGTGEIARASGGAVVVALQAWGSRSRLEGTYLSLDPVVRDISSAGSDAGTVALYAGDRRDLGVSTRIDYGLEYRGNGWTGPARLVPRLGLTRGVRSDGAMSVRAEVLLDPSRPGGRVAVEGSPGNVVRLAASLSVLPANAIAVGEDGAGLAPGAALSSPVAQSADRREVDLSVARDFGPVSGSLGGTAGRVGRRDAPMVEDGPLPIVSWGGERFYETRVGVAYRPWSTEMQMAYRAVAAEPRTGSDPSTAALDYRRIDLVVSQGLPSPRSLAGARLRALVAWQGLTYGAINTGSGAPRTGLASRLTGGVGLSF